LSEVEQAWSKPTGIGARAGGDDKGALDARYAAFFEAFGRNVARTRAPVALWGLVLLVLLVAQIGGAQLSRPRSTAAAALLCAGIVLTGISSDWSLLGLFVCLAATLMMHAVAEWKRTRFASRVHHLWIAAASVAVLLAL